MSKERDWPIARQAFLRFQKLLVLAKGMSKDQIIGPSDSIFTMIEHLSSTLQIMTTNIVNNENLTQIIDLSIAILHDSAKMTRRILDRHANDIQL